MSEWEDIERLLKQDAEKLHFEFQEEFWEEVAAELDVQDAMEAGLERLGASPFEFHDEYWDEMSAMLDESDRKKRDGLLFYIASGVAAVGVLFIMIFSGQQRTSMYSSDTTQQVSGQRQIEPVRDEAPSLESNQPNNGDDMQAKQEKEFHLATNETPIEEKPHTTFTDKSTRGAPSPQPELADAHAVPDEKQENSIIPEEYSLTAMDLRPVELLQEIQDGPVPTDEIGNMLSSVKQKRSRLFVTSGLFVAQAPKGNSENAVPVGLGGYVGIGYGFTFKRMEFRAGVNFGYRNGINHDLVYNRRFYGTQLFEETDAVSYKGIARLEVPLELCLSRGRHTFGFGVTPVWNAGVNSTYHKYNSYSDEEMLVRNNYGIREGINDFDVRLSLQYEARLTGRLSLGGRASVGLFNQINPEIFSGSNGLREVSGTLYLKYNILAF